MAKITTKPIIAIVGSRDIKCVNFDLYLDKSNIAQVISGAANGVDTLAAEWARRNRIELVEYKPNYKVFGKRAPLVRDEEMVKACDIVIAFWNGKSTGTLYTIKYAKKINRKVIVHEIIERD